MMPKLVESWRKVWSAVPGTTDPNAPFGLVSLADGTDYGAGINMRGFRWAQTANFGTLPNHAMPHTFMADAYDLSEPWDTLTCGTKGFDRNGFRNGTSCCVDKALPLGPLCRGDHRGLWPLNDTRDWANLGTLHPRMKTPVGARLAQGLHAVVYGSSSLASGPEFAGCTLDTNSKQLVLTFNLSLLRGEKVIFNQNNTVAKEDTALYVLVNATVQAQAASFRRAIEANHHPDNNDGDYARYQGPFSDGNEMGVTGWVAVAAKV